MSHDWQTWTADDALNAVLRENYRAYSARQERTHETNNRISTEKENDMLTLRADYDNQIFADDKLVFRPTRNLSPETMRRLAQLFAASIRLARALQTAHAYIQSHQPTTDGPNWDAWDAAQQTVSAALNSIPSALTQENEDKP